MQKHTYDTQTGINYTLQGDYYLPDLSIPNSELPIGVWGQRHQRYIKQHRKVFYYSLLTSCKLNSYLHEIDKQAEEMFFSLVKELAEREKVTEQLKSENPMLWVQQMNNICNRVSEIINAEVIYI